MLVKPDEDILEKIKHLPFDYYQIYDCAPEEIKRIKERYNKKIITALTVINESDVQKYHLFSEVTDIYLFDSKGYEKSMAFNHEIVKNISLVIQELAMQEKCLVWLLKNSALSARYLWVQKILRDKNLTVMQ